MHIEQHSNGDVTTISGLAKFDLPDPEASMAWSNILKNLFFGHVTTELVVESPLFLFSSSFVSLSDASLLSVFFPHAHDCNKNFVSSVFKIVGLQHVCAPVGKNKSSPMSAVDAGLASAACSNAVAKYPEGHLASLFDKAEMGFEEDAKPLLSSAISLPLLLLLPPPAVLLSRLPLSQFSLKTLTSVPSSFKSFRKSASSFILSSVVSPSSSSSSDALLDAHGRQHLALDSGTYLFSFAPPAYCPAFSNPTIKYPSLSHRNPTPTAFSAFLFAASRFSYAAK
jgi:hypothetical protein